MTFIASTFFALFASLFLLDVAAQDYTITKYTVTGTGCAPSTVSSSTTSNGDNISLLYNDFTAYAGPRYSYADGRKNCQLTMNVQVPQGYQFAFDKFNHNASYSIAAGVTGIFATNYYFQGSLNDARGNGSISGPAKLDLCTLGSSLRPSIWSPCGQSVVVNINTAVHVDNADGSASGSLTIQSTPLNSFVWRTC